MVNLVAAAAVCVLILLLALVDLMIYAVLYAKVRAVEEKMTSLVNSIARFEARTKTHR
jgi:hypothetical protein